MKHLFLLLKSHISTALPILALLVFALALIIAFIFFPPYQKFSKFLNKYNLMFPPNTKWEMATPESVGINSLRLDILKDDLIPRKTRALLIVRHNKIVLEWYKLDHGPNERYNTASLAKSVVGGISLLVVLGDGRIGIDDPAWKYIPAWKDHPIKSNITIRHLATHTSGIEDSKEPGKSRNELSGWKKTYWRNLSERFSIAIAKAPVSFPPGSRYVYSNPEAVALGYAISSSLKNAPQSDIRTLLKERIMDPIGVPESDWSISYGQSFNVDGMKLYLVDGGGRYTARAVAKVGQLMLNKGNWRGERLLDSVWVDKAVSPFGGGPVIEMPLGHPEPGLSWWVNSNGVISLPRDAFLGVGGGHQILLVVPSLDLVLVRFGGPLGDTGLSGLRGGFWSELDNYLLKPLMDILSSQSSRVRTSKSFDAQQKMSQPVISNEKFN